MTLMMYPHFLSGIQVAWKDLGPLQLPLPSNLNHYNKFMILYYLLDLNRHISIK
jgi:hypothetical protein